MALNYVPATITPADLGQPRSPAAPADNPPAAPAPSHAAANRPNDLLEHLLAQADPVAQPADLPLDRGVPLIGRQRLLADIRELLLAGPIRLALAGPPGAGKTRLALEVAGD